MARMIQITKMELLALILGVVSTRVALAETDQSEISMPEEPPIGSPEHNEEKRRVGSPEVVLQLKYESGELNRIYLAQFRKEKDPWVPSVPARTALCADLCHAGLGGDACGPTCPDMLPIGLQTALRTANQSDIAVYGEPRVAVCPALCQNHLGEPLCNCASLVPENHKTKVVEWNSVCTAFCATDRYVLGGCPTCDDAIGTTTSAVAISISRILDTQEGWTAWCNVQCRQGQGGAACNCDRAPFQ